MSIPAPPEPSATTMPSMHRILVPILALLAAVGCSADERPADFRFLNTEPETIDPGRVGGQAGGRIVANLFEGLTVRMPPSLAPGPGIATDWWTGDDGLTWTFRLRRSTWSDGTPLTARDFVWSWRRVLDPRTASKSAQLLFPIRGAREFNAGVSDQLGLFAPDDTTLVVELETPTPYFADLAAAPPLAPSPRHVVEKVGETWTRPEWIVSNGPYVLDDWRLQDRMRLRRNPRYWNVEAIALDVVEAVAGDFANANFNRYESGLIDWVDSGGVPPALVDALKRRPDWHSGPFLATYFLRCNVERPPLDDERVRRALSYALDAEAITTHVTRAGQVPARGLVPPGVPGYDGIDAGLFDVERARRLLAAAGYPGGEGFPSLTLLFNTSEWHRQIAEVLQQQWREHLGIEIELLNQEWKVFTTTVRARDYDLARGSWIGDVLDAQNFLEIFTTGNGNNRTGWSSERYDALIASASRTRDPERRAALLRECERMVVLDDAIILPVYVYSVTNLYDDTRWAGLEPDLLNSLDLRRVRPVRAEVSR